MAEASLELALVADSAKPFAFARCQPKVDLDTNGVHEEREPTGRAEAQTKSCSDLCFAVEFRLDRDPAVGGAIGGDTLRKVGFEDFSAVLHEGNLRARHGAVVVAQGTDDERTDDHDNAQCDDGAGVIPGSQHPGPVLFNLEPLDVVVCHAGAQGGANGEYADEHLRFDRAAERATNDHQSANIG